MAMSQPRLKLEEVDVQALDPARLEPLIGPERMARFERAAEATQSALSGRAVLNVNSTAVGGGVAEMLQTLLAYVRGVGVDARWLVIQGDPEFFAITKRIHNGLYGGPGDGGPLGSPNAGTTATCCAATPTSSARSCVRATRCSCTIPRPPASHGCWAGREPRSYGGATWGATRPTNGPTGRGIPAARPGGRGPCIFSRASSRPPGRPPTDAS